MGAVFKRLFALTNGQVKEAFKQAKVCGSIHGLKLLRVPYTNFPPETFSSITYGKLLIITPRICGKAHDRNKLRRQMKALFYEEKKYSLPVVTIVLVYKAAMNLDFKRLKKFMRSQW